VPRSTHQSLRRVLRTGLLQLAHDLFDKCCRRYRTRVRSPLENPGDDRCQVGRRERDPDATVLECGDCLARMPLTGRHEVRLLGTELDDNLVRSCRIGETPVTATPSAESDVMNADEVAAFLGVDRTTVYDFAGRGEIPHQRLGKRLLFRRGALVSWLDSSLCKATLTRKA